MINLAAARDKLAELITAQVGDRAIDPAAPAVYRGALDAVPAPPLIAVGVPEWEPDVQPCMDLTTIPVGVVVEMPGGNAGAVQDQLESLWSEVVAGLREDLIAQPGLGVAKVVVIKRARFGPFIIQGTEYPAMVTFLEFYG